MKFAKLLIVTLVCYSGVVSLDIFEEAFKKHVRDEVDVYMRTGHWSEALDTALKKVSLPNILTREKAHVGSPEELIVCLLCTVGVEMVIDYRREGTSRETLGDLVVSLCVGAQLESEDVCRGVIDVNIDVFLYMIDQKEELQSADLCSVFFESSGCDLPTLTDWSVNVDEGPIPSKIEAEPSNQTPLRILQLSDIHYDPLYAIGANADCGRPVCCAIPDMASNTATGAGAWGDYRSCDTPYNAVVDVFNHIIENHLDEIDVVYYTGDIVAHRVWATSVEANTADIRNIISFFTETFPSIPVYMVIGNHEPHPLNVFSPLDVDESVSTQWLYNLWAELTAPWLTEQSTTSLQRGGFYSELVRPGLRVIVLNNVVCYTFNWWLVYDQVDPYGQLQWLADTLLEAESNGEFVHILGHMPPGQGDCLGRWSNEYSRIINRFAHIIKAEFNGHTHSDQLVVFYNQSDPNQAISVAYNGGSVTTYSDKNPNYKIYSVDPTTYDVLDYDMYIYNITDANLTPNQSPNWYKLYSFKDAYGVENLQPSSISNFVYRMAADRDLFYSYFRHMVKDADTQLQWGCDGDCFVSNLCGIVSPDNTDSTKCDEISGIANATLYAK